MEGMKKVSKTRDAQTKKVKMLSSHETHHASS